MGLSKSGNLRKGRRIQLRAIVDLGANLPLGHQFRRLLAYVKTPSTTFKVPVNR